MIDMRTVLFGYVISNAVCMIVMALLWIRNRRHFAGIGFWLADFTMQFIAILLAVSRGVLPDFISMVMSNTFVIAGTILLLMGLERFAGMPITRIIHNLTLLAVFIFVHAYFTFIQPSLLARNINLSLGLILICSQCAWLLMRRVGVELRPVTRGVGVIFLAFCLIALIRIIAALYAHPGNDFFLESGLTDTILVLMNQMLFIALTFGLLLMVNRRLIIDLKHDISMRKQVEEALSRSEERYRSLFENMLDGFAYCKMIYEAGSPQDFIYLEVNNAFESLTGLNNVRGKKVTEVVPGVRESNPELLGIYGRVALTGRSERFETHLDDMGFWFLVSVYSNEPQYFTVVFENITERKRMEEALKISQKLAEELYASAPDALVTVNTNGRITRINSQTQAMFGYTREELLNQPIEALIPQRLHAKHGQSRNSFFAEPHLRAMDSGLELSALRKDGREFPVEIQLSPLQIGEETFVTASIRDISQRKQMDQDLHYRNNVLAALHQVTLDLVNRHEMDDILQTLLAKIGTLLDASDISFDLVENGDTLVTYAVTSDQPLKMGDVMRRGQGGWLSWQAIESGQSTVLEDYSTWSRRRPLFEGYPIHAIMIIPIQQRDHVIGAINISRSEANKPFNETDIFASQQLAQMVALVLDNAQIYAQLRSELAERRRVEQTLHERQENFQAYFNMGTVGMCVTSPERRWIEANARLCQMLGYTTGELDNLTWSELTHPDDLDLDLALYNQILDNQRDSYQLDKRFIRKDGSTLYTTLFVTCYRNPNRTARYFLASLVDITERRLAEESLLKLTAIGERQRMARDLHDSVNQSIHSLMLFSETLVATLDKNNVSRAREISGRVQESARQALKETRLLLYQTQASVKERDVDLLQELNARFANVELRAGVRAQIIQEGSLSHCPEAWHENLFWITIEALNNSLKYSQARGVKIFIRCFPEYLELEVADDGRGFDTTKPNTGGYGLRNMRERAEILGGMLTITSSAEGTIVLFRAEIKEAHG